MKKQFALFLFIVALMVMVTSSMAIEIRQENAWPLKKIEDFFMDPINNFESLKEEPNLRSQIELFVRYNPDKVRHGLKILGDKPDEKKAEILVFLLSIYPEYVIADEAARIFCQHPELLVNKLKSSSSWEAIITELTKRDDCLVQSMEKLGDSAFEKKVKEIVASINQEMQFEMEVISKFIEHPINNFNQIKGIRDLTSLIYRYERTQIKEGTLEESVVSRVLENLDFQRKEAFPIMIFLILHIKGGIYSELVIDKAARVFRDQPDAFLNVLKETEDWKDVIKNMYSLNPEEIREGIGRAKENKFIVEVKKYIEGIKF